MKPPLRQSLQLPVQLQHELVHARDPLRCPGRERGGVSENEQGLASGLFNTTEQIGAGFVLAIAVAASSSRIAALFQQGEQNEKVALTGGLQYALFVCHQCTLGLARGDRCDTREETYICFQRAYEYLSGREERCDATISLY